MHVNYENRVYDVYDDLVKWKAFPISQGVAGTKLNNDGSDMRSNNDGNSY